MKSYPHTKVCPILKAPQSKWFKVSFERIEAILPRMILYCEARRLNCSGIFRRARLNSYTSLQLGLVKLRTIMVSLKPYKYTANMGVE